MKYISINEIKGLNHYCKSMCRKSIDNHKLNNIHYFRGQYKGYMFGIKVTTKIQDNKIKITSYELYKHIKSQKINIMNRYFKDKDFQDGIINSLYDVLNYVSINNIKR